MAHAELRCEYRLHGVLLEGDIVEIRCRSQLCGSESGVIVLHQFDVNTGELLNTERYRNPTTPAGEAKQ